MLEKFRTNWKMIAGNFLIFVIWLVTFRSFAGDVDLFTESCVAAAAYVMTLITDKFI